MDVETGGHVDLSSESERQVARRIGHAWKELRRGAAMSVVRDYLFGVGEDALEPGQLDTLDLLAAQHQWRMSELAEALRVDPSTATRAVQRLERSGLAERKPSDQDGRVVIVSATPHGLERHAAIECRRREMMSSMMAEFSYGERRELAELLDRFVASLDHFSGRLVDRER